jgi:hypothetical protein
LLEVRAHERHGLVEGQVGEPAIAALEELGVEIDRGQAAPAQAPLGGEQAPALGRDLVPGQAQRAQRRDRQHDHALLAVVAADAQRVLARDQVGLARRRDGREGRPRRAEAQAVDAQVEAARGRRAHQLDVDLLGAELEVEDVGERQARLAAADEGREPPEELRGRGARRDLLEEPAAEDLAAVEAGQPRLGQVVAQDRAAGVEAHDAEGHLVELRVVVAVEGQEIDAGLGQAGDGRRDGHAAETPPGAPGYCGAGSVATAGYCGAGSVAAPASGAAGPSSGHSPRYRAH